MYKGLYERFYRGYIGVNEISRDFFPMGVGLKTKGVVHKFVLLKELGSAIYKMPSSM